MEQDKVFAGSVPGVVTRHLASTLPPSVQIVATDLNQPMLDTAVAVGTARPVEWRQADAMALPFEDASFDAVVCQFGAMFFPDRAKAFAETRRVLRKGGAFLFNVPDDPPRFMARTPHGYHDKSAIERDLANGGFAARPQIETIAARSVATSPDIPAIAYCQGTPWRNEIEARRAPGLDAATEAATRALAKRFGNGRVDGKIQAHVVAIVA